MAAKKNHTALYLTLFITAITMMMAAPASALTKVVYGAYIDSQSQHQTKLAPIVVYQNGRFKKPYDAFDEDIAEDARFETRYLQPGTQLTLQYDNRALGEINLMGRSAEDTTPTPLSSLRGILTSEHSVADFATKTNVHQQYWLLATNYPAAKSFLPQPTEEDPDAKGKPLEPLRPTAWDKSVLQFMARQIYKKKGIADINMSKLVTADVKARYMSAKDKKPALFGTFTLTTFFPGKSEKDQSRISRVLFIMAVPTSKGYRLAFTDYKINPPKVPYLLDALDITGDGFSEVIVEYPANQETEFGIYQRQKTGWKRVYTGGGLGDSFLISQ